MMFYLACISFLFLCVQCVNTLLNLVFRQKLKTFDTADDDLSVLIPARNEEKNIKLLLEDLRKIKKRNLEILVFDDQSEDNTAKVVQDYSKDDFRIKLIKSEGLPYNWLGKNHACYQLAQHATGKYYLFIDADVRIMGNIISDTAAYLKKHNLGLLSLFPVQIMKTPGEHLSVPVMNYILLTLLPLIFVRISPFKSHAAANGQFMLFDASVYDRIQPHKLFKYSAVEDIAIARFLKKQKINIGCVTGEKRVQCRMYQSYREAFNGFSKNVFMFFGNIPVFAFLFWIFASLGFIPVLFALPEYITFYIAGIMLSQILYSVTGKQNFIRNALLFPFHMLFLMQILINGIFVKTRKIYSWKGRYIYS